MKRISNAHCRVHNMFCFCGWKARFWWIVTVVKQVNWTKSNKGGRFFSLKVTHEHVCTFTHMHARIHTHTYMHACMCTHMHTDMPYLSHMHAPMHTHTHTHTHTYWIMNSICTYVCLHCAVWFGWLKWRAMTVWMLISEHQEAAEDSLWKLPCQHHGPPCWPYAAAGQLWHPQAPAAPGISRAGNYYAWIFINKYCENYGPPFSVLVFFLYFWFTCEMFIFKS